MSSIARLGYLGFQVADLDAWERFGVDILGLTVSERLADGGFALQMDDQARRLVVEPGPADDLAYVGFEVDSEAALRALADELAAAGHEIEQSPGDGARARRVSLLFQLEDPNGIPIELFCGPEAATTPFRSDVVPSGFVTGDEGLGHLVVVARDAKETDRFYRERLGMKLSDRIVAELAPGFSLDITFLHSNPRHHTLAFTQAPLPGRIHHFMLQTRDMPDVGHAYDRCLDAKVPIANTLGQHPNDEMFSFYAKTPSGFEVEIGWGGRRIDDATWEVRTYDRLSTWGHHPVAAAEA